MSSALVDAVNYHAWIMDAMRPWISGSVLEIGFGHGQYTTEIAKICDRVLAVDRDPECVGVSAAMPANVRLAAADASDDRFVDAVGAASHDSAVCLNVLEHIQDEPAALRNVREALKPGGRLFLLVPAHEALFGRMDSLAGHHRRYNARGLSELVRSADFEVEHARYFNPLGGLGWLANAKLARPRTLSDSAVNNQILLFDKYALPISRVMDPLTRRFFGQSLIVVARRKQP